MSARGRMVPGYVPPRFEKVSCHKNCCCTFNFFQLLHVEFTFSPRRPDPARYGAGSVRFARRGLESLNVGQGILLCSRYERAARPLHSGESQSSVGTDRVPRGCCIFSLFFFWVMQSCRARCLGRCRPQFGAIGSQGVWAADNRSVAHSETVIDMARMLTVLLMAGPCGLFAMQTTCTCTFAPFWSTSSARCLDWRRQVRWHCLLNYTRRLERY